MVLVDTNEPVELQQLIQQSVDTERTMLNQIGCADYMWQAADGHWVQIERKQWPEILSDLDGIEEQLRRELAAADELGLLIEGIIEPTPVGVDAYKKSDDKRYYRVVRSYGTHARPQPGLYHRLQAWLWCLDKAGITIYQTPNYAATAVTLVSHFQQGQKDEHSTLNRYIKTKQHVEKWNPHVLSLMGIPNTGIGEQKARALVERFETLVAVLVQSPEDLASVPGMGRTLAERLLRAAGREL